MFILVKVQNNKLQKKNIFIFTFNVFCNIFRILKMITSAYKIHDYSFAIIRINLGGKMPHYFI